MQPSNKEYNVVETFSGIGSQATALKNIGVKAKILNTCEWNLHAIVAYALIHDISIEDKKFDGSKEQLVEYLYSLGISNDGKKSVNKSALQCIEEGALNKLYAAITETNNLVDIAKQEINRLPELDPRLIGMACDLLLILDIIEGRAK